METRRRYRPSIEPCDSFTARLSRRFVIGERYTCVLWVLESYLLSCFSSLSLTQGPRESSVNAWMNLCLKEKEECMKTTEIHYAFNLLARIIDSSASPKKTRTRNREQKQEALNGGVWLVKHDSIFFYLTSHNLQKHKQKTEVTYEWKGLWIRLGSWGWKDVWRPVNEIRDVKSEKGNQPQEPGNTKKKEWVIEKEWL